MQLAMMQSAVSLDTGGNDAVSPGAVSPEATSYDDAVGPEATSRDDAVGPDGYEATSRDDAVGPN